MIRQKFNKKRKFRFNKKKETENIFIEPVHVNKTFTEYTHKKNNYNIPEEFDTIKEIADYIKPDKEPAVNKPYYTNEIDKIVKDINKTIKETISLINIEFKDYQKEVNDEWVSISKEIADEYKQVQKEIKSEWKSMQKDLNSYWKDLF